MNEDKVKRDTDPARAIPPADSGTWALIEELTGALRTILPHSYHVWACATVKAGPDWKMDPVLRKHGLLPESPPPCDCGRDAAILTLARAEASLAKARGEG